MNNTLILHHYDMSPYAEKIRLLCGIANIHWQSLLTSAQPPRPNLDLLTGGYRRIPVAQIGADIFCDSHIISQEIEKMTHCAALNPLSLDEPIQALMAHAEKEGFFAAITAIPPMRLLSTMIKLLGPVDTYRFVKDRSGLMKGGTARPPSRKRAALLLDTLLDSIESQLANQSWLGGEHATIADATVFHPLWLHSLCQHRPLSAGPKVTAWYKRVSEIGHGIRTEISAEDAFSTARNAEPRALPNSAQDLPVEIGKRVNIAPSDYGVLPVSGTLVAMTDERIIVMRDTSELGKLHVHFPRHGYSLTPQ
ncbi:Uncharacterised protein [Zhongshania aliphaticivorans]|uniref:GST N-terminal domain-containing protein n=1 Tax=Zhongshania aliphaticivorans TaxID=1470434 RepID=A0A5S9P7A2_9GAMM|nr:glutathione S-transferase family protein [Zhongshania aliphaticivorans]CAA0091925.1 Uncharacterised protein [Zhongshania aliphaticivorans]CAA0099258.1 Uncharacterised protein [Zhongshania aliphaticivorans]